MRASFPQADVFHGFDSNRARRTPDRQLAGQPVRESATAARFESRTKLTVQTADGDRVTISLRAQSELQSTSRVGTNGSFQQVSASSSTHSRINVQGELSDAELKDLTKLINALSAVSRNSQSGGGIESLIESMPELETLAGFRYSQRQTLQAGALFRIAA